MTRSSPWALDEKRFRDEVFKPLAAGWDPSENLFRCYLLPVGTDDKAVIAAALEGVQRHLNRSAAGGQYASWATMLRARHGAAAEMLDDDNIRGAHRQQVQSIRKDLRLMVESEVRGLPGVPRAALERLASRVAPRFTVTDVEEVLAQCVARLREPVALPAQVRPPSDWNDVRGAAAVLGFSSLRAYLLDRFRVVSVPEQALKKRKADLHRLKSGDAVTAEAKVIEAVVKWQEAGRLVDLLRTELLSSVAGRAQFGFTAARDAVSADTVAPWLTELQLPRDVDEVAYAVYVSCRYPSSRASTCEADHASAVASRDLRAALAILEAQPGLDRDWQKRRDALRVRVAELDESLGRARALEMRDPEAAAEIYLDVSRVLDAPSVAAGLRRCRPAPPAQAGATVQGSRVVITWRASRARAGDVVYRVVRGEGHRPVAGGGTVVVAAARTLECQDDRPPGGVDLHYAVYAVREGAESAEPTLCPPVVVLREVEDLEVEGGQGVVEAQWVLPSGAVGVRVSRGESRSWTAPVQGATNQLETPPRATSFHDKDVRDGVVYEYRVQAEFRLPDGRVHLSPGVMTRARTQERPLPVKDLTVAVDGDLLALSWTAPRNGHVDIRLVDLEPGDVMGRVVPAAAAARQGRQLRAAGSRADSHMLVALPNDGRRHWLLPVTVVDQLAAIGRHVEVNRLLPPVEQLTAVRLGTAVRLTWRWPQGIGEVAVAFGPGQRPSDAARGTAPTRSVTLAGYRQQGVQINVGGGPHWFTVRPVAQLDGVRVHGPAVTVEVRVPQEAYYEVRRVGRRWSSSFELRVDGVQGAVLPDVCVVAKSGVPPLDRAAAQELALAPSPGQVGVGLSAQFVVPAGPRPLFLRAFPASSGATLVLLPRRPDQLRIT